MNRMKMAGLCCLAVLAISGASSVSAAHAQIWLVGVQCEEDPTNKSHFEAKGMFFLCSGFKFTAAYKYYYKTIIFPVGKSVPATYNETMTDTGEGIGVDCSGKDETKIGSESHGEVTKVTVAECKVVKGSCSSPSAEAVDLPWKTELYNGATEEVRDKIKTGEAGAPGFKVTCTVLGIKVTDTCEGETNTKMTDGGGDVEAIFDSKSPKVNCSIGGAEKGTIEGKITVGPISETEAVFVE